jgi:predicted trehalose synthase
VTGERPGDLRAQLPSPAALAAWLPAQRWFAAKSRHIERVAVESAVPLGPGALVVARVDLDDGARDWYALSLAATATPVDIAAEPAFVREVFRVMASGARVSGDAGALRGRPGHAAGALDLGRAQVRALGGEQSNASVTLDDRAVLKQFRRFLRGANPEEEITRFLTERTSFRHAPRLLGSLAYEPATGEPGTVAVAHEFVPGAEDGWRWMLARLHELGERLGSADVPVEALREAAAAGLGALRRLGERTGQLHAALASDPTHPEFAPEPITGDDVRRWTADVQRQVAAARVALGRALPAEIPDVGPALAGLVGARKIRHHGDFHLGQTLYRSAPADFVIVDFEGEPLRPLAERRRKHAALRDVAGLLRSIGYAALSGGAAPPEAWRGAWEAEAARAFVEGYLSVARGREFVPATPAAFAAAVAAFELEKAAYEVVYEAGHRPAWVPIPLRGLVSAAGRLAASGWSASG